MTHFDQEEIEDIKEIRSLRKKDALEACREFKYSMDTKKFVLGLRKAVERFRREEKKAKTTINLQQNPILKRRDSASKREKSSAQNSPK